LTEKQFYSLATKIPPIYKNMRWRLLYRMSKHGSSMITFMKNLEREDITVIMIEDSKGYKFGSFCIEEWTPSK